jgi:hypothetical protein
VAPNLCPHLAALRRLISIWQQHPQEGAMDIVYIALTFVFFGLSWAFIVMCDRLMEDKV